MADSSWRSALLKCDDLRAKVATDIEAPKVASSLPTRIPPPKAAAISPPSTDAPLVPQVDKKKCKNPMTTLSSAVKKQKTQVSSPR